MNYHNLLRQIPFYLKQNLYILKDWLYNQHVTVYNSFTNQHNNVRHIKLSDEIDDIILMFLGDSNSYVELMCTGMVNVYTVNEEVFLRLFIPKTLLEKLNVFNTDYFRIKSNEETFYNNIIYFDLKECNLISLDNI